MTIRKATLPTLVGLLALASAPPVLACKFRTFQPYTPQTGPSISGLVITRVDFERGCGSGFGTGDCADVGQLVVDLRTLEGASVPLGLGATIDILGGSLPFTVTTADSIAIINSQLRFTFSDGHGQPAIDAVVVFQALDSTGENGAATAPLPIHHPGGNANCAFKCSTAATPTWLWLGLLWIPLWRARQRRRNRMSVRQT